ncbi:unnamed protein product [Linum trigynum]|uniref:Uncharacterized protein n=1 Tax=Linum trigynum TaxID=586398 RepID=A0AAV2FVP6_9ROSI
MKYVAIDYHIVRDRVEQGDLVVRHVPSSHQLVDLLTKSLSKARFLTLFSKIGVSSGASILQGQSSQIGILPKIENWGKIRIIKS